MTFYRSIKPHILAISLHKITTSLKKAVCHCCVFLMYSNASVLSSSACVGEVNEAALVRDILYVFQGIDGKFIKMSAQENCYKIDGKVPEAAFNGANRFSGAS